MTREEEEEEGGLFKTVRKVVVSVEWIIFLNKKASDNEAEVVGPHGITIVTRVSLGCLKTDPTSVVRVGSVQ